MFFAVHDPTTLNRQGADSGTQYRSAIFYDTPEQKKQADEVIAELTKNHVFEKPIVTEVAPLARSRRGLPPGLLLRQPERALLPGGDRSEAR